MAEERRGCSGVPGVSDRPRPGCGFGVGSAEAPRCQRDLPEGLGLRGLCRGSARALQGRDAPRLGPLRPCIPPVAQPQRGACGGSAALPWVPLFCGCRGFSGCHPALHRAGISAGVPGSQASGRALSWARAPAAAAAVRGHTGTPDGFPSCHSCERVLAGESWDSLTLPVLGQAVPSPAEKEGKRGHQFGHRWRPVPDPDAGLMTEVVQRSPASLTCWKAFIAVGKASPSKLTSPSMELIASATAQMLPAAGAAACLRPVMPFGITQGMLQEHGVGLELSRKTDGMAGASLSFCIRWEDALGWVTSLPMARGWN